ncbi:hypothetical protein Avbf_05624 [Armadillidium vulgare]|nr:hypothetical protein Avbf_05624 [Armadillidium vulgare]
MFICLSRVPSENSSPINNLITEYNYINNITCIMKASRQFVIKMNTRNKKDHKREPPLSPDLSEIQNMVQIIKNPKNSSNRYFLSPEICQNVNCKNYRGEIKLNQYAGTASSDDGGPGEKSQFIEIQKSKYPVVVLKDLKYTHKKKESSGINSAIF